MKILEINFFEIDRKITSDRDEQPMLITNLKNEIKILTEKHIDIRAELELSQEHLLVMEKTKEELKEIQKRLLISIETLEKDKETYENELIDLKSTLCYRKNPRKNQMTTSVFDLEPGKRLSKNVLNKREVQSTSSKNILILGDEAAINLNI
ncbi:unnamed protein product [Psylliodes chrysocephalus]|uniref:Uncharacterized protein n=1 Tax=Psylliodes chrysocephalus TaxID=3402493 RepID=A0A9P0D2X2_9CUCU|nr:unnamed protein product [Psylliodes chrysocephala]